MKLCTLANVLFCSVLLMGLSLSCQAEEPAGGLSAGWVDNFEAAKATAKKENKDLLVDFTGSDWCHWCVQLKKEVFDLESFKTFASKEFILVELDFPHKKKLDPKTTEQNKALAEKFKIQGYPSILLMNAAGEPYAKTGYQAGGPEKYVEHLKALRTRKATRDEMLKKVETATGVEKAKALDQIFEAMDKNGVGGDYEKYIPQIIELDKDNAAGLKGKYESQKQFNAISTLAQTDSAKALTQIEALLKDQNLNAQTKQETLFLRAVLFHQNKDEAGAVKALEESAAVDPKSDRAIQIKGILDGMKAEKDKGK